MKRRQIEKTHEIEKSYFSTVWEWLKLYWTD